MAFIESEAEFRAIAKKYGLTDGDLESLGTKGYKTMAAFAYASD